jgi:hypothetical protein
MAEKRNGLAPVPSALFRPTVAAADDAPAEEPSDTGDDQGRGDEPAALEGTARARPRRKSAPAAKARARNIRLSDDVHDRLWQLARQRRQSISAVADELLNRALPRFEVKRLA